MDFISHHTHNVALDSVSPHLFELCRSIDKVNFFYYLGLMKKKKDSMN